MIYYVATERHQRGTRNFLKANPHLKRLMKRLSYEELFFQRGGPVGHYIFTDIDRLSRFEIDYVSLFCAQLHEAAPEARQLNLPARVKERFPLLVALNKAGINTFSAMRIETGEAPSKYPVFLRTEDGCNGPETGLIEDDAGYANALKALQDAGKTRRGRLAIGYAAQRGEDGYFRKYGAYRVGGEILPHHLQFGRDWVVKRSAINADDVGQKAEYEALVEEELTYVRDNPHKDILKKVFEIAGVDFGRVDYAVVNGKVEIYEINTNPKLPLFNRSDKRNAIREITKPQLLSAFEALDIPFSTSKRYVRFRMPNARDYGFRQPTKHLPRAIFRRIFGG